MPNTHCVQTEAYRIRKATFELNGLWQILLLVLQGGYLAQQDSSANQIRRMPYGRPEIVK